jgi:hypothetical protein
MGKNKKGQELINKIKNTIDNTLDNQRETEKRINQTDDEVKRDEMKAQNFRRENSVKNMEKEIKNVLDKENNYK